MTSGGKRDNAGAKPIYDEPLTQLNIGVPLWLLVELRIKAKRDGVSLAAYVRSQLSEEDV